MLNIQEIKALRGNSVRYELSHFCDNDVENLALTAIKALERVEELEEKLGMRGECSCRERVHRHRITCNHHPDNL